MAGCCGRQLVKKCGNHYLKVEQWNERACVCGRTNNDFNGWPESSRVTVRLIGNFASQVPTLFIISLVNFFFSFLNLFLCVRTTDYGGAEWR